MDTIRIGALNTQNSKTNRTGGVTKKGVYADVKII